MGGACLHQRGDPLTAGLWVASLAATVRGSTLGVMERIDHTLSGECSPSGMLRGTRTREGIRGWLLVYVIGRAGLLLYQLQLTVGAVVIYADPAVAGLRTFVPLSAFLLYEATNWLLVGLTVLAFVLIRRRSRTAIAVNLALSGLWLATLVVWQFLGVNGHLFLPNRGHHFSPLVAMISPHWWPSNLPTIRAVGSDQVRGLTPLPAVAWASR